MNEYLPTESDDDYRDIEDQLRAMPLCTMPSTRRHEIIKLLRDAEQAATGAAERVPWWRAPIPLWRALAASLALAGASAAIALGVARSNLPNEPAPRADFGLHETATPAAIVFVQHEWPRRARQHTEQASIRGWRFMPVEHGEILQ